MAKGQRAVYDMIKKEKIWTVGGDEQTVQNVLELELRLHQVCGGFTVRARETERTINGERRIQKVYDPVPLFENPLDNPKIQELIDILDEFKGKQVTIWCMYRPEIDAIVQALGDRFGAVAMYHGGLSNEERSEMDSGFRSGKYRIMIANPQTGGMGLTWTSKDAVVVYYSNSNKLEDRVQSEDRTHRIGSTGESVIYIDLLMEKSVDLLRKRALDMKSDLSSYVRSIIREVTIADILEGNGT